MGNRTVPSTTQASGRTMTRGMLARRVAVAALVAGALPVFAGCAVSETDVHRWETTERGPEKLVAVATHDKYSLPLRTEAALSMIRMKPRGGRRIGIELLTNALASLPDDARKKIVGGMTPELLKHITAPRPAKNPDGSWPADPSIPYKDAAFAMLSHEPTLVSDDKNRADIVAALAGWTQTDFENRIENPSQQFGIEQMMRFFGAPSVRGLPSIITEESTRIDRIAGLIADLGDPETKVKGSEALVALAKKIESADWVARNTALVEEANRRAKTTVTPDQLKGQVSKYQDAELQKAFVGMKRLGGRPVVEYALAYGADKAKPEERRKLAFAAVEGRIDKGNAADIDKVYSVAAAEDTPDALRDLAFARMGELPKDIIGAKLYPLFEGRKWKIRWVAGSLILKSLSTKQIPEFMRHLPATAATKMGMTEPITYGTQIAGIAPIAGDPKARDAIQPYLSSPQVSAKLTALSFFYGGKKSDIGVVKAYEEDRAPVPKCDEADECNWKCAVPKAGSPKESEDKPIATVGEFVKYCVIPSMESP